MVRNMACRFKRINPCRSGLMHSVLPLPFHALPSACRVRVQGFNFVVDSSDYAQALREVSGTPGGAATPTLTAALLRLLEEMIEPASTVKMLCRLGGDAAAISEQTALQATLVLVEGSFRSVVHKIVSSQMNGAGGVRPRLICLADRMPLNLPPLL